MINVEIEKNSSKASCLEDKCFSAENSSCTDSFLKNDRCCNDDISQLDLVDGLSISATHLQNDDGNESSVSVYGKFLGCQAPPESKFDLFATGQDNLKLYEQLQQELNHDLGRNSEEILETDLTGDQDAEKNFFNQIFSSLLDLIISSKLMEMSVSSLAAESDQAAECKTPTHIPLLTGIAETCPPAPMRRPFSLKGFDLSICRKLNFESSLN